MDALNQVAKLNILRITPGRSRFFALVALMAALAAAAVVLGFYSKTLTHPHSRKWLIAIAFGLIGVFSCLPFIGRIRELVFMLSIFALPIQLDVFLYRKETPYMQLHGLPITLFHIFFLYLMYDWIVRIVKGETKVRYFPEISIPALSIILFSGLSILRSNDKALSLCALILSFISYLIFLYYANNFNEKAVKGVLLMMALCVMLQSAIGILQYVTGSTLGLEMFGELEKSHKLQSTGSFVLSRVGGLVGAPNALAMVLNLLLPALTCSIFMDIELRYKFVAALAVVMGLVTEVLTLSRGGWVALACGIYVLGLIIMKHYFRSYLKAFVVSTLLIAVSCTSVIAVSSDVRKRLFEDDYKAPKERIYLLQTATNVIKDNPLLGVGINTYTTVMARYDRTPVALSYTWPHPVHNAFFLLTAECGLFALGAALVMFLNLLWKGIIFAEAKDKSFALLGAGFFCGMLTWLVHSQFERFILTSSPILWMTFGVVVWSNAKLKEKWAVSP